MHQTPEQALFAASMVRRIDDAIWPLTMTGNHTLDEQKEKINEKLKGNCRTMYFDVTRAHNYYNAIRWLESSAFEWYADACGYGGEFVKRTADLVQDCLTWKAERGLRPRGGKLTQP